MKMKCPVKDHNGEIELVVDADNPNVEYGICNCQIPGNQWLGRRVYEKRGKVDQKKIEFKGEK